MRHHEALAMLRPKPRTVPTRLALLFGLRYLLDRYGHDPCDEWDIDTVLGLPDGLSYRQGAVQFQCRRCDNWSEWPVDVADFDIDGDNNLCGGSPRCCP